MSEMKLFEQIEDYLKNRLTPAARQAFEVEIAADPVLAKEVTLHRDMMEAIDDHELDLMQAPASQDVLDFRDLMEQAYDSVQADEKEDELPDSPPKPAGKGKWYGLIALMLLLVALGTWWMQQDPVAPEAEVPPVKIDTVQPIANTPNIPDTPHTALPPTTNPIIPSKQDYAAVVRDVYAESPYAPGVLMSDNGDDPAGNPLPNASKAYAKIEFEEVVRLLEKLPDEGRTDALKLRAHAFLHLHRYDQAATDFEALTQNAFYKKDAEWYLLLCHAARLPKTKTGYEALLIKVSANGPKYEQRVSDLKKRLAAKK